MHTKYRKMMQFISLEELKSYAVGFLSDEDLEAMAKEDLIDYLDENDIYREQLESSGEANL